MSEILDGRYEVIEKIKDGGMGSIYKSRYLLRNEIRVVKTMKSSGTPDEKTVHRFQREARLATSLRHPNIATVHECFQMPDGHFAMAMEFIDGFNLSEYARSKKELSVAEVVDVGVQTLDALAYLHSKGIIHRDISPENIMLQKGRDGRYHVKLIDLGVAKELKEEGLTETGMFVGKIRYSSPEQLGALKKGERIDGRSDIYSLGIVLYQFLTGQLPVFADSMQGYILGHVRIPAKPFNETDPEGRVPLAVRLVVMKSLEKQREDRWRTAEEFGTTLQRLLEDLVAGRETAFQEKDENGRFWAPKNEPEPEPPAVSSSSKQKAAAAEDEYEAPTSTRGFEKSTPDDAGYQGRLEPPTKQVQFEKQAPRQSTAADLSAVRPKAKSSKNLLAGIAAGAAIILATVLVFFALRSKKEVVPVPVGPDGSLVFTASPWAEIVSITDAKGQKLTLPGLPATTPFRIPLPPGKYTFMIQGPGLGPGMELRMEGSIEPAKETHLHSSLPGFDPEPIISRYAQ